jgi:3-oxoacyl-[acyl-carrier protein] reductase
MARLRWDSLFGKSFWVTGGGTGFGQAMALCLSTAGARVFVSGRRVKMLDATAALLATSGISNLECVPIVVDLRDPTQIERACQQVSALCPDGLNGLINNAALADKAGPAPLLSAGSCYWDEMFAVNLRAPWLLSRSMAPVLAATGRIKILNITSTAGWAGTAGVGIYNTTKAALNNLTMSLAEELAVNFPRADVQVNALDPGQAHTEMNQGSAESPNSILPMAIKLLSCADGGPNGRFFHKDGRHLCYGFSEPFDGIL